MKIFGKKDKKICDACGLKIRAEWKAMFYEVDIPLKGKKVMGFFIHDNQWCEVGLDFKYQKATLISKEDDL